MRVAGEWVCSGDPKKRHAKATAPMVKKTISGELKLKTPRCPVCKGPMGLRDFGLGQALGEIMFGGGR